MVRVGAGLGGHLLAERGVAEHRVDVGQQPFGGGRASGTNDKAGAAVNLLRWTSPRSIKETFVPPKDHRYPYMDAE